MTTRRLSLIAAILGIAMLGAAGAEPVADHRMLITGQIEVVEQDLHGEPTKVELVSPELGRFVIASDRRGDKLLAHVGEYVTVFGDVEVEGATRIVHVDEFRLLQQHAGLDSRRRLDY